MKLILVPTDFSACANNAVRYAIQLAAQSKSDLLFFHTVYSLKDDSVLMKQFPDEYKKLKEAAKHKLCKNILLQYKKLSVKPGVIKCEIKFGEDFTKQLIALAGEVKTDLLVVGTHGAGVIKAALFGSNTSHLIAKSPVPVLSVPGHYRFTAIKELVYVSDISNVTDEMRLIKSFCKKLSAKLAVVHFNYGWAKNPEELKGLKKLSSSKINFSDVKASIEIPLLVHIKRNNKNKNSLVCLFHDKKNLFQRFLSGSNAEEASMKMNTPVLSIQRVR